MGSKRAEGEPVSLFQLRRSLVGPCHDCLRDWHEEVCSKASFHLAFVFERGHLFTEMLPSSLPALARGRTALHLASLQADKPLGS